MDYPRYDPTGKNTPLSDDELDALDRALAALPGEQVMNVEALDGYLTALLLAPTPLPEVPTAAWLPAVWGGDGEDGAPFASNRKRKDTAVLVLRHLHSIACALRDDPENWQPVFSVAEVQGEEMADAEDWCIGFLQAVALDAQGWSPRFDDPELSAALAPIALLGGDDSELPEAERERLADPAVRDELSRAAVDAVLVLHQARQQPAQG